MFIMKQFEQYDRDHPEIWREFERIATFLIASGKKRYGAKAICEIIRYNSVFRTRYGYEEIKINNTYIKGYALKFMTCYPKYHGFFEVRR